MNMLLAGIALLHWPGAEQLELVNDPEGYQVCCAHATCVKWMCTSYTGLTKHSLYVGSVTAGPCDASQPRTQDSYVKISYLQINIKLLLEPHHHSCQDEQ